MATLMNANPEETDGIRPGDTVILAYDNPQENITLTYRQLGASELWIFTNDVGQIFYINPRSSRLRSLRRLRS